MSDLLGTVPAQDAAAAPAWLRGIREDARRALSARGLPGKKDEAWRFTSVKAITTTPFSPAEVAKAAAVSPDLARLGDTGGWRLVLVDGVPRFDLSAAPPAGVHAFKLSDLLDSAKEDLTREDARLLDSLGALVSNEHFAALNGVMFQDGLVLKLQGAVSTPIELVHVVSDGEASVASYPRLLVVGATGSEATLIERYVGRTTGGALTNAVAEVLLQPASVLRHVRVHEDPGSLVGALAVQVERDARYRSHVATLGGGLMRLDVQVALVGTGAEAELEGVYHVQGDEVVDHHVRVDHQVPHGTSHTRYRGVLDERGHGVFDAMAVVRRDAQRTEAHQENRNLLLSREATAHTKPHLEIDADDVRCSHGATVGSLEEDQLFYLRARGIPAPMAEALLTHAFVGMLVDRIPHAPTRARVEEALFERLPHGDMIRDIHAGEDGI